MSKIKDELEREQRFAEQEFAGKIERLESEEKIDEDDDSGREQVDTRYEDALFNSRQGDEF